VSIVTPQTAQNNPLRVKKIDDRSYELYLRRCSNCEIDHFEVWRWCGLSFSRYHLPNHFSEDDFEAFVDNIDDMLLTKACDVFVDFFQDLRKVHSPAGIIADHSFSFRLMEYARHRCSKLEKLGLLNVLASGDEPANKLQRAAQAAFELGMATAEYRLLTIYEEYVHAGIAAEEWREAGLPRAREERLRQGAKTREAIVKAAKRVYVLDRDLVRNDVETARRILKLDLPELQKGKGLQIGIDAVTRHLRAARKAGLLSM
jgi:hypothetical protein